MIEFRVHENIDFVRVDRALSPQVVVSVPQNSSWQELKGHLRLDLSEDELDLAQKIWCQDDFPRVFELREQYVAIRPAVSS
jgi:hypothetical protein